VQVGPTRGIALRAIGGQDAPRSGKCEAAEAEEVFEGQADFLGGGVGVGLAGGEGGENLGGVVEGEGEQGRAAVLADAAAQGQGGAEGRGLGVGIQGFERQAVAAGEGEFGQTGIVPIGQNGPSQGGQGGENHSVG
jgi:hypothetical protein